MVVVVCVVSCGAASRPAEVEPRYVAVHNAMVALGLAQVGPVQRGSLAQGREARFQLDLGDDCTTVVLFGQQGVRDLDATLLDGNGTAIAKDATQDAQAVLHACPEQAGAHTLVVRMAAGAGDFMIATWAGKDAHPGGSPSLLAAAAGAGTCDSPIPLSAGTFMGSTSRGDSEHEGTCTSSASREIVYRFELTAHKRVTIDVSPSFDSVIYLRKDDCAESDAEVACNDDAPHDQGSRIDTELDPGVYYFFVDGYSNEAGTYKMTVAMNDVPTVEEVCQRAPLLTPGLAIAGNSQGTYDHLHSNGCGDGAKGHETPYRLDVVRRSRVRIIERSSDFSPVLYLRKRCTDAKSEISCTESGMADGEATFTGVLDPGSYTVVADATEGDSDGAYSLNAEVVPEGSTRSGHQGETCADAMPLSVLDARAVGDTLDARDDISVRCGAAGAPDLVYRVELSKRSRIFAQIDHQEGSHVLALRSNCMDVGSELACAASIDRVVDPGVYYLIVDGDRNLEPGRFSFAFHVREVAAQENACRAASTLASGRTVKGTTASSADKFVGSCAGASNQASPDAVHKIVVPVRGRVRLDVTSTFSPVLFLRRQCIDPVGAAAAEVSCARENNGTGHARLEADLDPGTYYAVVDGLAEGSRGTYSLDYAFTPAGAKPAKPKKK